MALHVIPQGISRLWRDPARWNPFSERLLTTEQFIALIIAAITISVIAPLTLVIWPFALAFILFDWMFMRSSRD